MKITFLGAGNMGGAIVRGLISSGVLANNIAIGNKSHQGLDIFSKLGCVVDDDFEYADFVVVAVKPWQLQDAAYAVEKGACVVSIAAGVTVEELEQIFNTKNVVRVMPNTAVEKLDGVSFITGNSMFTDTVAEIFGRLGRAFVVEEKYFDACMALGSCGLAFALRYARASITGAVELGLKPALAQEIIAQTMRGAASILENGNHPEAEIDKITTPGGVTIKGLNAMEQAGFTNAVIQGLVKVATDGTQHINLVINVN